MLKRHYFLLFLAYALALLSFAAGAPKIMQMPQELEFLAALGFSAIIVSALGLVQVAGGTLLLVGRTRFTGAMLAAFALLVSALALFVGGNTKFGAISLLPVLLALLLAWLLKAPDNKGS